MPLQTRWPPWMAVALLAVMAKTAAANIEFFLPLGCFKDNANRPDMNEHTADIPDSTVNKDWCARACNNLGHPYGGLQMATKCFCGDEYAKYGFSNTCNYTCASSDSIATTDQCGGLAASSIIYTVDSDPAKRISRIDHFYNTGETFINARKKCVQNDGDLLTFVDNTVIDALIQEMVVNRGIGHGEYWIGLRYSSYYGKLTWVNPTSQGMSQQNIINKLVDASDPTGCVVLDTQTKAFRNIACTATRKFFCKQVPPTTSPTSDPAADSGTGDGGSSWLQKNGKLAFFIVCPLFLIVYGGSCIVYIIGKSWRYCKRRQRLAKLKELGDDRPLTSRDIKVVESGSPPPPYYRANSRGRRLEESKQPLVTNEKFPSRSKHYKHEDDVPTESDPAIDFSKLSIQDIIYIKSLMGERRPPKKKREIIVA